MWNSIKSFFRNTQTINSSDPGLAAFFGMRQSEAGIDVGRHTVDEILSISRGIEIVSDFFTSLPVNVIKTTSGYRENVQNHPAWWLLNKMANADEDATSFWHRANCDKMKGNAYVRIMWANNGRPVALYRLDPRNTFPVIWRNGVGVVGYDLSPLLWGDDDISLVYQTSINGTPVVLQSWEVMHAHGPTDPSGVKGKDLDEWYRDSIGQMKATVQYTAKFFKNDCRVPYWWEAPEGMPAEDRIKLDEQLSRLGGLNSKTARVMPNGVTGKQFSITPKDLLLVDLMQFDLVQASLITGLPASWLNSQQNVSYGSLDADAKKLLSQSVDPHCDAWEGQLFKLLSTDQQNSLEWSIEFDRSELENTNLLENKKIWLEELKAGAIDINEYREATGRKPRPESAADQLQLPTNQGFAEPMLELAENPPEPQPLGITSETQDESPEAGKPSEEPTEAKDEQTRSKLETITRTVCNRLSERVQNGIQKSNHKDIWSHHGDVIERELAAFPERLEAVQEYFRSVQDELDHALPEQVQVDSQKLYEVVYGI